MIGRMSKGPGRSTDLGFLPEDYIERRRDARTNMLCISLFVLVTLGVVGAFFVTSRQWNDVKRYQEAINVRYTQAAKEIDQLKTLEQQKSELLEKAELTTFLIEKVPRTILLAELINRMPLELTLLEFEMETEKTKEPRASEAKAEDGAKSLTGSSSKTTKSRTSKKDDKDEAEARPRIQAPRMTTRIALTGVAPTHQEVARYVANLQECGLLTQIDLKYSQQTIIQDKGVNKFRIEAVVQTNADARRIEPLENPRLNAFQNPANVTEAPDSAEDQ